ncbi:hypothetical protein AJ87_19325 [Rhizobium yanglingense]|nr:hypothetical protein AJ87_19325 [Rhizobium yanglingense]
MAPFCILGSLDLQSTATEQAPVNLTLTVFKINTVIRTVEVCHFTFLYAWNAKSAGDFLDRSKHRLALSFVHSLMTGR